MDYSRNFDTLKEAFILTLRHFFLFLFYFVVLLDNIVEQLRKLINKIDDNGGNASKYPVKNKNHKCKSRRQTFETKQLVQEQELLTHSLDKTPRKSTNPTPYEVKRKLKYAPKTINGKDEKKSRQEQVEAISDCAEGYELDIIINKYQMDTENLMCTYSRVCACLQGELNTIGEYSIEAYGSITNGLMLKTSDIDLHISLKGYNVKSYNHIIFRDVSKMLYKSKCFTKVLPIGKAKVPIIKCVHKASGISLDINTSDLYGVHNSNFVRDLVYCDPRIHKLMLFLKIWCMNMHIKGEFNMTNYCLIVLIIFYLQNSNPHVLASIKILQLNAQKKYVNGVNFGVNLRGFPLDNSQSTGALIKGFFHFYQTFKFEDCIIAPYLGMKIKRDVFDNQSFIYPEYENQLRLFSEYAEAERLRTDLPVCIQDAFCLNKNVGKCLTETDLQYFKKCVHLAHERCSDSSISQKGLYKYLLVNLLDDVINVGPQVELNLANSEMRMSFDIFPRKNELESLSYILSEPLLIRMLWARMYMQAIVQVISDVYRINMTLLSSTESMKFKKTDESNKAAVQLPSKWAISCYVDLWSGRQIQRTTTKLFMEFLLEETNKLKAERRQDSNYAVQLKGYLNISVIQNYNALRVEVSSADPISNKDLKKFFNTFKCVMLITD